MIGPPRLKTNGYCDIDGNSNKSQDVMTHQSVRLPRLPYAVQMKRGGEARLVRASRFRGDPKARAYLVAVSDKATAIDLITACGRAGL